MPILPVLLSCHQQRPARGHEADTNLTSVSYSVVGLHLPGASLRDDLYAEVAMRYSKSAKVNIATAGAFALCLAVVGCQSGLGGAPAKPSAARSPFVAEYKKIDAAGRGRITLEQATTYYSDLFTQLDKNGDGLLDANELEAMLPAMDAKSGQEIVLKFDKNGDKNLSRSEFLVIVNWLFQLATSPSELALGDVER